MTVRIIGKARDISILLIKIITGVLQTVINAEIVEATKWAVK